MTVMISVTACYSLSQPVIGCHRLSLCCSHCQCCEYS